jgi:hypothetical protein
MLVALVAHHAPVIMSCNGMMINTGFSADSCLLFGEFTYSDLCFVLKYFSFTSYISLTATSPSLQ